MRHYTLSCLESPVASFQRQCLYLRYEDVVSHPEASLRLLQEFTGIPLSEASASQRSPSGQIDYQSSGQTQRPLHSELYGQAPSPSRIGNYQQVLSADQIEVTEQICASIIERFRYSSNP